MGKFPAAGTVIRIRSDYGCSGYYCPKDLGVIIMTDGTTAKCDFNGFGNPHIQGNGRWWISKDSFEICNG